MLCNADYLADLVPCDMAVNATIAPKNICDSLESNMVIKRTCPV